MPSTHSRKKVYGYAPSVAALVVLAIVPAVVRPLHPPPEVVPSPVDPRSAPWYVIAPLDGAGERLARRVVAYRRDVESLPGLEQVRRVPGVGSLTLDRWWPWLGSASHLEDRTLGDPPR